MHTTTQFNVLLSDMPIFRLYRRMLPALLMTLTLGVNESVQHVYSSKSMFPATFATVSVYVCMCVREHVSTELTICFSLRLPEL